MRDGTARDPCTGTARCHGHPVGPSQSDDRLDLLGGFGQDDDLRGSAIETVVVFVNDHVLGSREHATWAKESTQRCGESREIAGARKSIEHCHASMWGAWIPLLYTRPRCVVRTANRWITPDIAGGTPHRIRRP